MRYKRETADSNWLLKLKSGKAYDLLNWKNCSLGQKAAMFPLSSWMDQNLIKRTRKRWATQALEDELMQFSCSILASVKGSTTKRKGTSLHGNGQSNEACVNFQFPVDWVSKGRIQRYPRGKKFKNLENTCGKIISYVMNLNGLWNLYFSVQRYCGKIIFSKLEYGPFCQKDFIFISITLYS